MKFDWIKLFGCNLKSLVFIVGIVFLIWRKINVWNSFFLKLCLVLEKLCNINFILIKSGINLCFLYILNSFIGKFIFFILDLIVILVLIYFVLNLGGMGLEGDLVEYFELRKNVIMKYVNLVLECCSL